MDIKNIECIGLEKRNKQQVYVISVTCGSDDKYTIERPYTAFFDFRTKLVTLSKNLDKEVAVPALFDLKWIEKTFGKGSEKRKRQINDFCKELLKLPKDLSRSDHVYEFFKKWPSDNEPPDSKKQDGNSSKNDKKRQSGNKKPLSVSTDKHLSTGEQPMSKDLIKEMQDAQRTRITSSSSAFSQIDDYEKIGNQPSCSANTPTTPSAPKPPLLRKLSLNESTDSLDQYVATKDYQPSDASELTLNEGDIVNVHEKNLSGWWFVIKDQTSEEGWAPGGLLQPLDPDQDDPDSDTDMVEQDECPIYEAISDYKAKTNDEVTYKKSEKVQVLQMRTDGWWKVRSSNGVIGITPAVNLARISDGSGPLDPLYSDITMYSQQSLYRKKTPPKRTSSRLSLSELYAKVERTQKKAKPSPIREHPPTSLTYQDSTVKKEKSKPQIPPKNFDQDKKVNYTEVDFNEDQQKKSKVATFVIMSEGVEYSEINPVTLPAKTPDRPENHLYLNVKRHTHQQDSYENITEVQAKIKNEKYFELKDDYNPTMKHREGLPAVKGDVVKVTREDGQFAQNVFCVMCLKERIDTKPCEGWIPKKQLQQVNVDIIDYDSHNIPVVNVISYADIENENNTYADAIQAPKTPERSKVKWGIRREKKGEWFAGPISRKEAEDLLKNAKNFQFLVRESAHGNDDYSISLRYIDSTKHFKIEKTEEGRYEIGGHVFKHLSAVIKHYSKYPLFVGENRKNHTLGKPFIAKQKH